jgi:integrase
LPCDIDGERIAFYQAARKSENASARTLNKELQVLRQVLKRYKFWAALQGAIRFEREFNDVGKAMSEAEEARLLRACDSNLLLYTIVTLALNTALRKNEIRTLRWCQINLVERTLTVGRAKTEGSSGRLIPLNSISYAALVRWAGRFAVAKPDGDIFPACEDARLDCASFDVSKVVHRIRSNLAYSLAASIEGRCPKHPFPRFAAHLHYEAGRGAVRASRR